MGIKVANIIEEGRLGGPQIRIVEVAKHLLNIGVETTIIFPKYQNEFFKSKINKYGLKKAELPLRRLTKDKKLLIKYFLFFINEIILLCNFLKRENFDVIHCSGGSWQYKGVIAGKLAGSKTLWHLNDTEMSPFIRVLFGIIALFFVDGYIVAGKRVKDYYIKQIGSQNKPIFEIQAPVDTYYFDPEKVMPDLCNSRSRGLNIVTIGNVNPWKGFEYFIRMAGILNLYYDDLNFFIVGPHFDSQKNYTRFLYNLKKELNLKNLKFYGFCQDVRNILKSADIYVCSSIAEGSPMSVWEAMSMEKAIVSSDVGDVSRFLKNDVNGFLVPVKDAVSLADKVKILIDNPELRRNFGKKARVTVRRNLDIKIVVKKHVNAYRSALGLSVYDRS